MNVLLVATTYSRATGGLGTYVELLSKGLAAQGHVVRVAVRSKHAELAHAAASTPGGSGCVTWAPKPFELLRLIRASDVTHMNGFWLLPATLSLLTRTPLVWTHHEYDTACPIGVGWYRGASTEFSLLRCMACMSERGLANQIPRRIGMLPLRKVIARAARANITPSAYMASRLALPRTVVVEHGTTEREEEFPPALSSSRRFLFVGRLVSEKGCDTLVEAAALCRTAGIELLVEVCGDGPERPVLEDLVRRRGLESVVLFAGQVSPVELERKLADAFAVVIPSRWDEVAGFVALEAMAGGVPIVASRVGGLAEMVGDAGLLVNRESPDALARAMKKLVSDPLYARTLGNRGRARYRQKFRVERMIHDHECVYARVSCAAVGASRELRDPL